MIRFERMQRYVGSVYLASHYSQGIWHLSSVDGFNSQPHFHNRLWHLRTPPPILLRLPIEIVEHAKIVGACPVRVTAVLWAWWSSVEDFVYLLDAAVGGAKNHG